MLRTAGLTVLAAFSAFAFACTSSSTTTGGSSGSSGSSGDGSSGDGGASSGTPGATGPALPETAFVYVSRETYDKHVLVAWDLATDTKTVISDLTADGSQGHSIRGFDIAPDRKSVVLASLFEPTQEDVQTGLATRRLHTMSIDGKSYKHLTPVWPNSGGGRKTFTIEVGDPAFGKDGSEIFFSYGEYWYEGTNLQGGSAIWKVPAAGTGLPTLAWPIDGCSSTDPSTDPKSGRVAVQHSVCTDRAKEGIWLHTPDGSSPPVKVVGGGAVEPTLEPVAWARDGSGFAFVGLKEVDIGGGQTRRVRGAFVYDDASKQVIDVVIPNPNDTVDSLALAPDASALVYCVLSGGDYTTGRFDLHVVDLTAQPFKDVAITNDGKSWYPRW